MANNKFINQLSGATLPLMGGELVLLWQSGLTVQAPLSGLPFVHFVSGGLFVDASGHVGFNGTSPIAKPTVAGNKSGNAALTSLISALANYGLIIDTTT